MDNATSTTTISNNDDDVFQLTDGQFIAMSIAIMFSSVLSIIGSSLILWMIYIKRNRQKKQNNKQQNNKQQQRHQQLVVTTTNRFYHRHVAILSITDIVFSTSSFLQPWLVPARTHNNIMAIGNIQSCSAIGFLFLTFMTITAMLSGSLSVYFLLTIVWHRSQQKRKFQSFSIWVYVLSLGLPLTLGIIGLIGKAFNYDSTMGFCLIAPLPNHCDTNEEIDCIRGDNILAWIPAIGLICLIWIASLIGFICTLMVYCKVRNVLKANEQYRFENSQEGYQFESQESHPGHQGYQFDSQESQFQGGGCGNSSGGTGTTSSIIMTINNQQHNDDTTGDNNNSRGRRRSSRSRRRSKESRKLQSVRIQAVLYSIVYFNSFIWPLLLTVVLNVAESSSSTTNNNTMNVFPLLFLSWLCFPLQGFFNFFVYIRPNYTKLKLSRPELTKCEILNLLLLCSSSSESSSSSSSKNSSSPQQQQQGEGESNPQFSSSLQKEVSC